MRALWPLLILIFLGPALAWQHDEKAGGCRVNGDKVYYTTGEFVTFLGAAEPDSIRLLEFSGDGSRLHQSLDEYEDGHLENVLRLKNGVWSLTDKSGQEPDPQWADNLKRALRPDAVVYFYGCQTGWYDHTEMVTEELSEGIARAFSEDFQVSTIGCPEFVFYPGRFPEFGGQFFSNPTEPPTAGHSTPGGVWNVFKNGRWYRPLNRAWVTSVKGLPEPRMPAKSAGKRPRTQKSTP